MLSQRSNVPAAHAGRDKIAKVLYQPRRDA
jgi:hypothetical protein